MGFLVGNLYSIGHRDNLKWYLYVVEPESESPTGAYLKNNFARIAEDLGTSAAIVVGHTPAVSNQIMEFLEKYLSPEMQIAVQRITSGRICALATNKPLPNTDSMVILPICDVTDSCEVGRGRIQKILDAIKNDTFQELVDKTDSLKLQQGHFQLTTTDAGIMFLKKANQFFPTKIPLLFFDIELSKIIDHILKENYPEIGG